MAAEFKLPDLGENIDKGEVISVLVAVGDRLAEDQPVLELETDKAVIEVPSSVNGTIAAIHVSQGDTVAVGQPILVVEDDGSVPDAGAEAGAAVETAAPPAGAPAGTHDAGETAATPPAPAAIREVRLPELGEGIDGGAIVGLLVGVGDQVAEEQGLVEIEIDKGVVELPAPAAGRIAALHVSQGERVTVGQLVAVLQIDGGAVAASAITDRAAAAPAASGSPVTSGAAVAPATASPRSARPPAGGAAASADGAGVTTGDSPGPAPADQPARPLVPAAPSVRRLAREIGVDIGDVEGTGPGGRISAGDVKSHSRKLHESRGGGPAEAGHHAADPVALPDFNRWGPTEVEPFSNVRRITARRMTHSWTSIPHVTQFDTADVTDLEVWRRKHGPQVEKAGGKLTPTALILKVVAAALGKFPQFSASIDMAGEQVIYKKYCHIGVAVDTRRGLLVPVIRDVDAKTVTQISVELTRMAETTRTGRIGVEEMQGGCFTVSNLGGIGGTGFTPIVNAPEVAILGVARSRTEAVYVEGQLQPRLMMPLSLSYDHRLIDGADGARFLRFICEGLENPYFLAFEG